jgi:hypothetical protein
MSAINQFKIVSLGREIDTYDNTDISFNYQIDDIEDLTKKKSSFSKTIIIPGTANNNDFFKNIFEINIDISNTSYNPKKSLPVQVLIGDEQIFGGNLQLLNIITNQKLVEYEVVITGIFKNIIVALADYYLQQLSLEEFDHNRNVTTITDSFLNIIKVNGLTTQVTPGTGYIYPITVNGNSPVSSRIFNAFDLNPAVYVKTIIDKIFEWAGYTYSSEFFNSDYFKALVVPCDTPQQDSQWTNDHTVRIGASAPGWQYPQVFNNGLQLYANGATASAILQGYRPLSAIQQKSSTWFSNISNGSYYSPFLTETGNIGNTFFQDPLNEWVSPGTSGTISQYTATEAAFYSIDVDAAFRMFYIHRTGASFKYLSGNLWYKVSVVKVAANGAVTVLATTGTASAPYLAITPPGPNSVGVGPSLTQSTLPGTGVIPGTWLDLQNQWAMNFNIPSVWLNVGEKIRIRYDILYPKSGLSFPEVKWTSVSDFVYAMPVISSTTAGVVNRIEIKPATTVNYAVNSNISLAPILPTIKMRDFFINIIKMFNLMVSDDPNVPNNLIIEPRDEFFASKQFVRDWTLKLDYDEDIKQTPMSELDILSYRFTYDEDSDYYNDLYSQQTGRVYGDYQVDFLNDFSTERKELKLEFAPTPVSDNFVGPNVAPFFCDIDGNSNLRPKKVKPRILFTKYLTINQPYFLRNTPTSPTNNRTRYIYAGMYDDPFDPEYSLEFGNSNTLYYNTSLCCPNNTLINQFYLSTLNDITDVNSKLLEAYFWLTPSDLNQFDFRDIILIDNSYWRVNTIVDYNPNAIDRTTKVILYKLNYLDIFYNNNKDISTSEIDCPEDVIVKPFHGAYIYVSVSNQPITEACCLYYGGYWSNGYCKALPPIANNPNQLLPNANPAQLPIQPEFQVKSGAIYTERPFELSKNQNIVNSDTVIVKGTNNYVDASVKNTLVMGEGNTVYDSTTNSIILGDNYNGIPSNTILVNGLVINSDGFSWYYPVIIDAGYETVMNVGKTNLIDFINGGYESVRNYGGDSKLRPIVDGSPQEPEL